MIVLKFLSGVYFLWMVHFTLFVQSHPIIIRDQEIAPVRAQSRLLNINTLPNGAFNRLLSNSETFADDVADSDDHSVDGLRSGYLDAQDRRRHRDRQQPCVPFSYYGRQAQQGRTFLGLFYNLYNVNNYQSIGSSNPQSATPIYNPSSGYPCIPLGQVQLQNQRPFKKKKPLFQKPQRPITGYPQVPQIPNIPQIPQIPEIPETPQIPTAPPPPSQQGPNRPFYPGTEPFYNDVPRPSGGPLGFFGPGGLFDFGAIFSQFGGSPSATSNNLRPVTEQTQQDGVRVTTNCYN